METWETMSGGGVRAVFQYPLVDWGDGDSTTCAFCKLVNGISVSSGGLG